MMGSLLWASAMLVGAVALNDSANEGVTIALYVGVLPCAAAIVALSCTSPS